MFATMEPHSEMLAYAQKALAVLLDQRGQSINSTNVTVTHRHSNVYDLMYESPSCSAAATYESIDWTGTVTLHWLKTPAAKSSVETGYFFRGVSNDGIPTLAAA